ncbi:MAG: methionine gamma-lyase family protein [Lachnospirales bacterium]
MNNKNYIRDKFNISEKVYDDFIKLESEISYKYTEIDNVANINQSKVLWAMQKNKLSEIHFQSTTGSGYKD